MYMCADTHTYTKAHRAPETKAESHMKINI